MFCQYTNTYVAYHVPAQTAKKNLESPRYGHILLFIFPILIKARTWKTFMRYIYIYCTPYIIYIHNPTLYGVCIKNYQEKDCEIPPKRVPAPLGQLGTDPLSHLRHRQTEAGFRGTIMSIYHILVGFWLVWNPVGFCSVSFWDVARFDDRDCARSWGWEPNMSGALVWLFCIK